MKPDEELISVSAAATRLGLNRSTLGRQIRTGQIRTHAGKVRMSEVVADRSRSVDLARSARSKARHAATARPRATPRRDATPTVAVIEELLVVMAPIIAGLAVEVGSPMRAAYALSDMIRMGLANAADDIIERRGLGGPDFEGFSWDLQHLPDWSALARRAGELVDIDAWEAFTRDLPWFADDDRSDAVPLTGQAPTHAGER